MKKITTLIAAMLVIISLVMPIQAQALQHVYDNAGTFTADEIRTLEQDMASIYEEFGVDTMIVTTNNSKGMAADYYAADFYESVRPYQNYKDYVSFAFCFDIGPRGSYGEAAYGKMQQLLTARGDDQLYDILAPYLPSRNYAPAMQDYLRYIRKALTPRTPLEIASSNSIFVLIGAVVVAGIVVASFLTNMKRAKSKPNASMYAVRNSLSLRQSNDIFLYQTESRTKIEPPKSSGGGGGGRSFTSGGSGRSYGGRSGSL